jgi:Asp-tRNA(Asn)/Glu-tRNA(Gln) amidotransferase A subunit family amidase
VLGRSADECLARIAACDSEVRAWVEVSPQPPLGDGPLAGVPFGAKDIFETLGMATEYGSPLYAGRKGACDAAVITALRLQGAVLLGKTHTAAFAYFDPPATRNPRDLRRTPGGSSSGSAAAVAAGMAAFALGTQTQGSILRPASYCGVVGFKPTFGALPCEGVLPFAPSLDTVGFFTASAGDMRELWNQPREQTSQRAAAFSRPCEPPMAQAFADAILRLRGAGFRTAAVDPPDGFDRLLAAARVINDYEGARTHQARWREHWDRIGLKLAALVARGLEISAGQYQEALETVDSMRVTMAAFFQEYPVVLTPAAPGAAPLGLESTGDPAMNAPWTALGVPAISVPMLADGPPLGLQMTAAWNRDAALLETAIQVEACLSPPRR